MNASSAGHTIAFGIPKLPPRYAGLVMPLLLSIIMTCIVSLISTLRGIGLAPHFLQLWMSAPGPVLGGRLPGVADGAASGAARHRAAGAHGALRAVAIAAQDGPSGPFLFRACLRVCR